MKSCKRKHYEPASLEIKLVNQEDVITMSPMSTFLTTDDVVNADYAWVSNSNQEAQNE